MTEADMEDSNVAALDGTNPSLDSNDGGDNPGEQLSQSDSLVDRGLEDPLDEGYSPPDYEPTVKVPTQAEEAEGLSMDELLAAEEPDVDVLAERSDETEHEALELGGERAGRLVDYGEEGYGDTANDVFAEDRGFSGGGASAEEAAMHIFDPDGSDEYGSS